MEANKNPILTAYMRACFAPVVELHIDAESMSNYADLDKIATFETDQRLSQDARADVRSYLDMVSGFRNGQLGAAAAKAHHEAIRKEFLMSLGSSSQG